MSDDASAVEMTLRSWSIEQWAERLFSSILRLLTSHPNRFLLLPLSSLLDPPTPRLTR
jgi:hypothetical protein